MTGSKSTIMAASGLLFYPGATAPGSDNNSLDSIFARVLGSKGGCVDTPRATKGPNLLTGKKLLLADDSAAIQKVIDLTFSDEGMNVTAVGDGQRAWEELEQFPPPDVIIADVFMPGIGGYELCRLIKQNDRLAQIPVMLLVSSFEPFDEGEARRAGADDIVTKPFQSIRQLVSRVGSLVQGRQAAAETHEYPAAEFEPVTMRPEIQEELQTQPTATVLVEAPVLETHDEPAGPACATDIDFQTADTQRLERVTDEEADADKNKWQLEDTVEVEPVKLAEEHETVFTRDTAPLSASDMREQIASPVSTPAPAPAAEDSLLELDEDVPRHRLSDDVFLDLDFEEQSEILKAAVAEPMYTRSPEPEIEAAAEAVEPAAEIVSVPPVVPASESAAAAPHPASDRLSEQAIDAIAEKVVQRLSDKVVREIAWEVVPDLAQLMIKKKLDEQK